MRHETRLIGNKIHQMAVSLNTVDGGKPQTQNIRHLLQQCLGKITKGRLARQVRAIARGVHPGQHDLAIAAFRQPARLIHHGPHRHGAGIAAPIGYDAEGAAMIAAVLHLNEGAHMPVYVLHHLRRGGLDAHDIVDEQLFFRRNAEIGQRTIGGAFQLLFIAQHRIHLGHLGKGLLLGLGGAAGNDDTGMRIVPPRPADGLACLAHRLTRHGAGIDQHGIVEPGLFGLRPHHFRFIGVETTAEGYDLDAAHTAPRSTASRAQAPVTGSTEPDHSHSAGPVMMT